GMKKTAPDGAVSGMPAIRETGPGKNLQAITVSTTMQTVGRIRRLRRIRHVFPQIRTTAPARRQSHQTLPPSPLSAIRLSLGTLCAA
ncbi:hypothetical protein GBS60_25000, partial [Escherichia coli]|nr:hypothetical protein [Escherichia coli]